MTVVDSYLMQTAHDLRTWSVEVYADGQAKVTDINSPAGYFEWVSVAALSPEYNRPNLYAGCGKGTFSESTEHASRERRVLAEWEFRDEDAEPT